MDIWLIENNEWVHIRPTSIHGMLWLQTHFESDSWEALASGQVKLQKANIGILTNDAKEAGLILTSVPSLLNSKKS